MQRVGPLFFGLFSFLSAITASPVFAACSDTETDTDFGCIPNDPVGLVAKFYRVGLGLIGGVAVLFIMYGGYLILTSQGDPEQLSKARSYIYYSVAGLLLAVFGIVFMQTIAVDILHIPGFK